jgi:glycosyltransferase involved in cell wall biosynthesis
MKPKLKQAEIQRLLSVFEHFDTPIRIKISNYDELIENLQVFPKNLRSLILWLVVIGNYPSKEEKYLLETYLNTSPLIAALWLKKKRRSYVFGGLPKTFIESPKKQFFFDVSETCQSDFNSGIQRIVRESAKQLREEASFVRWEHKHGILTSVTEKQLEKVLNWKPTDGQKIHLKQIRTVWIPKKINSIKNFTIRFLSNQGQIGKLLLRLLKFFYLQQRRMLLLKNFTPFRDTMGIIFQPGSKLLVLELQSLDLRTLERVNVHLEANLYEFNFLIHDTLPLRYPEFFTPGLVGNFVYYFRNISIASKLFIMANSEMKYLENALAASSNFNSQVIKIEPPLYSVEQFMMRTSNSEDRFKLKQILIVGSLEPRKNHVRMIRAIIEAKKSISRIKVVLVIPNEWMSEAIKSEIKLARDLGIDFELHYSISDEQLLSFYCQSTLLMYCSIAEGLGLPLLEARSVSLPSITSNRDFMWEVARTGGAVTVNPFEVVEMSRALVNLLSKFDYWQQISNECSSQIGVAWPEYAYQFVSGMKEAHENS